jgi:hypothetical protein
MGEPATIQVLADEFRESLVMWRNATFGTFEESMLAWLLVVPVWTERLAEIAGFPTGSEPLESLLERLEAARLCERGEPGSTAEMAQRSARAMYALWGHLSDADKARLGSVLHERAQTMPDGSERRRILRESEIYAAPTPRSGGLAQLTGAVRSVLGIAGGLADPELARRAEEALSRQAEQTAATGAPTLGAETIRIATKTLGAQVIPGILSALALAADPKEALRAAGSLCALGIDDETLGSFVVDTARKITPGEDRARLLLQTVIRVSSGWGASARAMALEDIDGITDPVSRAMALLEAVPILTPELRSRVVDKLLETARQIELPELRAQILASSLPLFPRGTRAEVNAQLNELALTLADPAQRVAMLAVVACEYAALGDTAAALKAAEATGTALDRTYVLLEMLAAAPNSAGADEVLRSISPAQREQILLRLSPAAGEALGIREPKAIVEAAQEAAAVARFAAAAHIAAFLTDRPRRDLMFTLLDRIRAVSNLPERLEAVATIAKYLPGPLAAEAWEIASSVETSRGFWAPEARRTELLDYLKERRGLGFSSRSRGNQRRKDPRTRSARRQPSGRDGALGADRPPRHGATRGGADSCRSDPPVRRAGQSERSARTA